MDKALLGEFIKHPGASACIPYISKLKNRTCKNNFRYSISHKKTYEIPAGKIDIGETLGLCKTGIRGRNRLSSS